MEAVLRRLLLRRRKSKARLNRDYSNPELIEKMNDSINRHCNMMMSCYETDAVENNNIHPSQMIIQADKNVDNMSKLGSVASLSEEFSYHNDSNNNDVKTKTEMPVAVMVKGKDKKDKKDKKKRKEGGDTVVVDVLDDDHHGSKPHVAISKKNDMIVVSPNVSLSTAESSQPDPQPNIILSPTNSDKWDVNYDGNDSSNTQSDKNDGGNGNDADGNKSGRTDKAITYRVVPEGPRRVMSDGAVKKDESKLKKIAIRLVAGLSMVGFFVFTMLQGHVYICALIFCVEVMLFRELVKVRYNTFFHIIEETIPLFRTTQWLWFVTSIFYTSSDFIVEVIKSNTSLHYLLQYAKLVPGCSFLLYSLTFVITISTMQKDHIRFQINQLCWTILVLCLTVGQLKYIMHNVYNGLIWFALPLMLVVSNDSFAWLAGITCGRKFITRPFIRLSPNKTWEGFIGGWIGTMFFGWYLSAFMAQYSWMVCPNNDFNLFPGPLECEPNPIFHKATNSVPPQIFELFPQNLVRMIPKTVEVCAVGDDPLSLAPCVSGDNEMQHDHFEMVLRDFYPVQVHALGLSLFASFVAPFGGFAASAIKRAYAIKDFDSLIPGHGGMMDRFDCQLLMALCTWVHYNTFVSMATVSVPKMLYMYNLLNESEQADFLKRITALSSENNAEILAEL